MPSLKMPQSPKNRSKVNLVQNLRYFNIIAVSYEIFSFFFLPKSPKLHLMHLYAVISYNCYNKVMQI